MRRTLAIVLIVVGLAALTGFVILPMWTASVGMMTPFLWAAFAGGIVFTAAVAGGLMFLIFYSARHGYDDAVEMRRDPGRSTWTEE
jgi:hypothetical protein